MKTAVGVLWIESDIKQTPAPELTKTRAQTQAHDSHYMLPSVSSQALGHRIAVVTKRQVHEIMGVLVYPHESLRGAFM